MPRAGPSTRPSERAGTATPARFARSSTGYSTSPASCSKKEPCSTHPARRRKTQLRDSQGHGRGEGCANSCRSSPSVLRSKASRARQTMSTPTAANGKVSLQGVCPARRAVGCADIAERSTRPSDRKKSGEGREKSTCKKVGSPIAEPCMHYTAPRKNRARRPGTNWVKIQDSVLAPAAH